MVATQLSALRAATPSFLRATSPILSLHHLDAPAWRAAAEHHRNRVEALVGAALTSPSESGKKQQAAGDTRAQHPIYNFLFTYYSFDPGLLLKYSPGPGVTLRGVGAREPHLYTGRGWTLDSSGSGGSIDPNQCKVAIRRAARVAASVMRRSADRAPHLHCFGLHEWAMLYAPQNSQTAQPNKHQSLPLRLAQDDLNKVVESLPIHCTHFDAYRFFTTDARPLNQVQPEPSRPLQAELEQPGCVHASMDLFRYAVKLWPFLPSTLLADALELAIAARVLDMRASPYDVASIADERFDLSPVRIETEEGRREYQRQQAALASEAKPVRKRLIEAYDVCIEAWDREEAR